MNLICQTIFLIPNSNFPTKFAGQTFFHQIDSFADSPNFGPTKHSSFMVYSKIAR